MALLTTQAEWHDIRIDPEDLPGEEEPIMVTVEYLDGRRGVWMNVYMREDGEGNPWFCTEAIDEFGLLQRTVIWYPVIAWAYPPLPYTYR